MLKKSLIAIALFAIALPAVAGDLKVHDPWPKTYVKQTVTKIDIILDVGYYIHVKDQKPIEVYQDTSAKNPYKTYKGCKKTDILSNFEAKIDGSVSAKSPAGGGWWVKFDGQGSIVIPAGKTNVEICVGTGNLAIEKLVGDGPQGLGGAKNVKVAELTIRVLPAN